MAMDTKGIENLMINVPKSPDDRVRMVDIFIWDNKYKEANGKETTFEGKKLENK